MDQEQNLGVTEARFGLTLLICLLVAIGYVVLLRLGSAGESAVVIGPDSALQPAVARDDRTAERDVEPRVLPVEPQDSSTVRTSQLPGTPAPHRVDDTDGPRFPTPPPNPANPQRR